MFPIPPDVMLLPMVLADRASAFRLAAICSLASLLGACLGYAIGLWGYELIGRDIIAVYQGETAMQRFFDAYNAWGAWVVFAAAISFIPFKIATIASGITGMAFLPFLAAATAGRMARFYLVAFLTYQYGPSIQTFIERYFNILSLLFVALLLGGFLLIGYL